MSCPHPMSERRINARGYRYCPVCSAANAQKAAASRRPCTQMWDELLDFLGDEDEVTVDDLMESADCLRFDAVKRLQRWYRDGRLERIGVGRYRVVRGPDFPGAAE